MRWIMKISDNTIQILKNFSTINTGLKIKQGNVIRTISPNSTVFAEAIVNENFPKEFALYDLNKLLAKISLYKDADIDFNDTNLSISNNNRNKMDTIRYSAPKVVVSPPDKTINIPSPDCELSISQDDIDWMRKSANISRLPIFVFESDGESIYFSASDPSKDDADTTKIRLGDGDGNKFVVNIKSDNFKLLDGSYDVSISKKGLARFKHKTINITYFIAIESNSKFV